MKTITHYQCELCDTIHDTQKEAETCERGHYRGSDLKIFSTAYFAHNQVDIDCLGFPTAINLRAEGNDSVIANYRLQSLKDYQPNSNSTDYGDIIPPKPRPKK